jgi:hypothetical protein
MAFVAIHQKVLQLGAPPSTVLHAFLGKIT